MWTWSTTKGAYTEGVSHAGQMIFINDDLADPTTLTPTHTAPDAAGEGFVTLKVMSGDPPAETGVADNRKIIIYEDHLARVRDTFGVGTFGGGPRPHYESTWTFRKFNTTITMPGYWNCHGGTWHIYDGSHANGLAGDIPDWEVVASEVYPLDAEKKARIHAACDRGYIVAYYVNTGALAHSQTVLTGTTTYGANNIPVTDEHGGMPIHDEGWTWAESEAGVWAENVNEVFQPVTVKVLKRP